MSAPRHGDQVHVAARFMRLPAVPTTEAYVRIATAGGTVDVKVSQAAVLTTEGKPVEFAPLCTSIILVKGEGIYLRCEYRNVHPKPGTHWARFSPSDVEWDDDDPNAVRIES